MHTDYASPATVASSSPTTPLSRLPLLPPRLLKQHHCFVATDSRFRAAARLLQSLFREDAGWVIGAHISIAGAKRRRTRLGSRLSTPAAQAGRNFIDTDVHRFVRRELVLREEGAMIDEDRLFGNMLSSMPLTFNLLAPLVLDLSLATAVWRQLLPDFVHIVTSLGFEHSPGRGRPEFLADGTAFDAALQVITPEGEPGMVFVEVKYSEGMSGPAATPRPRYDEASRAVQLYRDPDSPALRSVALEQLWREHMLAQLAVQHDVVPRAHFVVIAPQLNRQVTTACSAYAAQLAPPTSGSTDPVGFSALTLESTVEALAAAGATGLADALQRRYLAFDRILALALAAADSPVPSPSQPASSSRRDRTTPTSSLETTAATTPGTYVAPPRRTRERLPGQRTERRVLAIPALSASPVVAESASWGSRSPCP